jgi:hypothetical protein
VRDGLELLDATLHPTHVIRHTDNLTLANAFELRRSVELEIAATRSRWPSSGGCRCWRCPGPSTSP